MVSFGARLVVATVLTVGLVGGARAEEAAHFDPAVARRITPQEFVRRRDAGEKPIILDTRGSVGDVIAQGAQRVTNDRIPEWAKSVKKDAWIVAYCT
jgi:hypothetical protein